MSAIEPIATTSPRSGKPKTAQEWMDALAAGSCDQDAFLRAVNELSQKSPDACWEVLSLLDQYYRRGKIKFELFQRLETHIQSVAVGAETNEELSVPLPVAPLPARESGTTTRIGAPRPRLAAQPWPAVENRENRPDGAGRRPAVGDLLRGRYRLERVLGKGGTGTVFEAVDQFRVDPLASGQRLAIKVLHTAVAERQELFLELRREFQHLQSLSHPNIVRVHEFDRDGDTTFFTMELLSGSLLGRVLRSRHEAALNRSYSLAIIRGVGAALAHAHSRGVVHGDVSPENIFITDEGEVRVLDFGASRQMAPGPWISGFDSHPASSVAAPRYASCQLLEGQRADARDDLYALACIAYVLLSGTHPFQEHTAVEARTLRLNPRRPAGLTRDQWQALRSGLSIERERRPSDLDAWLRRLDPHKSAHRLPALAVLMNSGPARRRFKSAYVVTAAILMVLAALWVKADYPSPGALVTRWSTEASSVADNAGAFLARMSNSARRGADGAPEAAGNSAANAIPSDRGLTEAPAVAASTAAAPASNTIPARPRASARPATPPPLSASQATAGNPPLARIEFAKDTTEVLPGDSMAQVTVRRKGNLRGNASFTWWTESGTAKPGTDFVAVAPRVEQFDAGRDRINLLIPVVSDPRRRQSENFYVVIDQPGPGASLGERTLAMVSILTPEMTP